MFAISDKEWPGISKLTEEAGEVLQVCGKLMATRGTVEHWDGTNLKARLEEELADLTAAISFVTHECHLDFEEINRRANKKLELFYKWHTETVREENAMVMSDATASIIQDLWYDEYSHSKHLCGLCGNSGIIDTTWPKANTRTNAGVRCGVRRYCICLNGRIMLRGNNGKQLTEED